MPLSDHSWGVAFDVDSSWNGGYYPRPGEELEPWSTTWMKIWPKGLPRDFVQAFRSTGFDWGGAWTTYVDPMHFSLRLL
jgi:hypothetical protein